jgi:excisionase family DNA binding protein
VEPGWLSVEQVAERLGLHVRTVRGYIRSGRLTAVRIGKQYRITRADLGSFTGQPAATERPRVEVSAVVELSGVGQRAADRLATLVTAGAQLRHDRAEPLRVQSVYDDERARLKIIILGDPATAADMLHTIHSVWESENGMFAS